MIKIGITQRVEYLADRGERRDCLDQEWAHLLTGIGIAPVAIPNRPQDLSAIVSAYEIQGFILTGGNDICGIPGARNSAPERDATERRILDLSRTEDLPVLGVCRGLQMMVVDGGGQITPTHDHTAVRHSINACSSTTIPVENRAEVNSFHNFGVSPNNLGPDWLPQALAHDGTAEAVAHRHFRHWAIMWHPERDPFDIRDLALITALFPAKPISKPTATRRKS